MNRRDFIAAGTATLLLPAAAQAANGVPYKRGLVEKHLEAGDTVFLDFYTDWCSTCASQGRTIEALLKSNPDYEENIVFIKVDWDQHSNSRLARRLKIPRRSTLVALKGDEVLGKIIAQTSRTKIKDLMDTALAAAQASA